MYNKIVNPQTGRKVNINSELGNNILKQYIKVSIGGKPKGRHVKAAPDPEEKKLQQQRAEEERNARKAAREAAKAAQEAAKAAAKAAAETAAEPVAEPVAQPVAELATAINPQSHPLVDLLVGNPQNNERRFVALCDPDVNPEPIRLPTDPDPDVDPEPIRLPTDLDDGVIVPREFILTAIKNTKAYFKKGNSPITDSEDGKYKMGDVNDWHVHVVNNWHIKFGSDRHGLQANVNVPLKAYINHIGDLLEFVTSDGAIEIYEKDEIPTYRRANVSGDNHDVTFERYKVIYFLLDLLDQFRSLIIDQSIIDIIMMDYYLRGKIEDRDRKFLDTQVARDRLANENYKDSGSCRTKSCSTDVVERFRHSDKKFKGYFEASGRKKINNMVKHQYCRYMGCDRCDPMENVCDNYTHIKSDEIRQDSDRKQVDLYVKRLEEKKIPTAKEKADARKANEKKNIFNLIYKQSNGSNTTSKQLQATIQYLKSLNSQIKVNEKENLVKLQKGTELALEQLSDKTFTENINKITELLTK